jgi:hypothetical protein
MGQQSVGKSFALNHLLDISFGGSTMGTKGIVFMPVVMYTCAEVNRGMEADPATTTTTTTIQIVFRLSKML